MPRDPIAFAANVVLWALVLIFFASHLIAAGVHYALR